MKKLKAVWELMRLEHGVMIAIAILIGSVIAQKNVPSIDKFLLTFCTALFLEASTFALNDYYDYEIDKKNQRLDRPLVRGDLLPREALYLFFIFFPLGILSSFFVNLTCFIIAGLTALFAIVYDMLLKKIKVVGNFFIAYVMAIPFVFGAAAVQQDSSMLMISSSVLIVALIAFLTGVGREIMKDVMDFAGDHLHGVKSFPRYVGIRASNIIAATMYIIAVAFSFIPFFLAQFEEYYFNFTYFFLVFITDTMLLSTSIQLLFKKQVNMKFYRKFTLIAMFFGLLAFLLAPFLQFRYWGR